MLGATSPQTLYVPPVSSFITSGVEIQTQINTARTANFSALIVVNLSGKNTSATAYTISTDSFIFAPN